jgi:F0F1-type ATP synthase assembly protein I
VSHPPEYPGRRRLKRAAASAGGGGAYEGAFEAVGAILVATGIGYWVDHRYGTTPYGVVGGAAIGFTAFVLRLVRLGRQLHPDAIASEQDGGTATDGADDAGPGPTGPSEGEEEEERS